MLVIIWTVINIQTLIVGKDLKITTMSNKSFVIWLRSTKIRNIYLGTLQSTLTLSTRYTKTASSLLPKLKKPQ